MPYFSPATGGASDGFNNIAAGTQTATTAGTVLFSNANNVTFGMNNSSVVTASASLAGGAGDGYNILGVNGVATSGSTTQYLSNGNNVSFGLNAGTITASASYPAQTNQNNSLYALGNTTQNSSTVLNASALSFNALGAATMGYSNGSIQMSVPVQTQFVLSDSNGVSFGTNGSTVTATVRTDYQSQGAYLTTARASNDAVGLNTAQTNVTWTVNSSGISLNAGAYLTTAMASNASTQFVQANAAFAGTNASGTIASNGISVSVAAPPAAAENNWFNLLGANTAGNTTASGSTIGLSGVNVTLSGTNGSQIIVSGGGAGGAATLSYFRYPENAPMQGTSSQSFGVSTMAIQPFQLRNNVSASYIRMPISVGFGSTTFASGANTTHSLRQTNTYYAIVYSQGVGASSRSIQSVYSSSLSDVMQIDARIGAASNNQTVSHFFTYGATGNSSIGYTTGYSPAASSIVRVSTTHLTQFNAARFLDIPFATLLAPGNYWLGIQISSATAVSGTAGMNANTHKASYYNLTQISTNILEMGANTTAGSNMWQGFGHGNWTTNSSGATTASINLAQVSTVANQPVFPFEFRRQA